MVIIPSNPVKGQEIGPLALSLPSRLNQNPLTFNAQLLIYLPPRLTLKNYTSRQKIVLI
jgi:hypothetical protein